MSQTKLFLVDELSTGLASNIKEDLFEPIEDIREMGTTIFLTEQVVTNRSIIEKTYY